MQIFLYVFIIGFTLLFVVVFFMKAFGLAYIGSKSKVISAVTTSKYKKYLVTDIIDGDTIVVKVGKYEMPVRLIGVNSPESVHPNKPEECYAEEARNIMLQKLFNNYVKLISDRSQDDIDKYDRLLRYIVLEDGTNFNKWLIQNGYAVEYTYKVPYKYQKEFIKAETYARNHKKGLWGDKAFASYLADLILKRIEES
ncbi:nuclease [Candidatus Peregrinibacteria bacterium]|nr:nuclease [Candidatus Peregrinibacteria bacterium]